MAKIFKNSELDQAVTDQVLQITDELDSLLANYEIFKHALVLLNEVIDTTHPKATLVTELIDAYGSRSECFLENLHMSVDRLHDLVTKEF